ncbi:MAG: UDP-3-O-(3-hydroxymyristoyl)glucosamine N-acyltransferase [Aquificae bacterium]|nr:UDP-3-O-(3-hydroxymyristoyl)glucosamine N-acyltransferase [Aquificota bacterium]
MYIKDLARVVEGELFANGEDYVIGISSPENPKEGTVVFCRRCDVEKLRGRVKLVVTDENLSGIPYIKVGDVKEALARFLSAFFPEEHPTGISSKASIGEGTELGEGVYVGDFVVIGRNVKLGRNVKVYPFTYIGDNTVVGEGSVIFSGVHIYRNTVIGRYVRIHSGAVIGADGFGYHISPKGIIKLNHIGSVVIEDFVEIGANTTIDRALIDATRIRKETKVDNLVMVGHNCDVGERNILVSQVGLSGSVRTGRNVILAGQVGVADHVRIGDDVVVTAKSGVASDLEGGKTYGANLPAIEWSRWKRIYVYILKLPELFRRKRNS